MISIQRETWQWPRWVARAGLLFLMAGLIGCAGSGSVEGTVTYKPKGKKLVWGNVVITGRDNIARTGMINPDGTYVVNGVPAGEATINVSSENPKPAAPPPGGRGGRGGEPGEDRRPPDPTTTSTTLPPVPEEIVKGWFAIPSQYADPGKAILKVTVKSGKNLHDIVLE